MMSPVARTSGETTLPGAGATPQAAGPALGDFLAGPETRMRDLLAFGMAVEAGRPPGPDGIEALRRRAEAELESHAFRVLHNQVETIRRQAVEEQIGRLGGGLRFRGAVLANLLALALAGGGLFLARELDLAPAADLLATISDRFAQLLAQFSAR